MNLQVFAFIHPDGKGVMITAENIEEGRMILESLLTTLNESRAAWIARNEGTDSQFDSMIGGQL